MIMPSEWMPVVWGDDDGPVFDDMAQAQAISSLIMGHYNDIIRQLDQGRYSPIYDVDLDDTIDQATDNSKTPLAASILCRLNSSRNQTIASVAKQPLPPGKLGQLIS